MAGYSGTPLAKKLGLKNGSNLVLLGAPDDYAALIQPVRNGVKLAARVSQATDIVHVFSSRRAELLSAPIELPVHTAAKRDSLGFLAQRVLEGDRGNHRRYYSRTGSSVGVRRCQGLGRNRRMVGSETGRTQRTSLRMRLNHVVDTDAFRRARGPSFVAPYLVRRPPK
jgi:hypothetical protein